MHLYLIARGKKAFIRRFMENLEFCFVPYEYEKGKTGTLQLVPREVKILELVFPEPSLNNVLNLLGDDTIEPPGKQGKKHIAQKLKPLLAKMLKLKPIPKMEKDDKISKMNRDNVAIHLIGTKKDHFNDGIEQI